MQHIITRCKHCHREYVYCTYGNGPEYGTEEGCSREYCSDCQKAIDEALKVIPVKFKPVSEEITDEMEKEDILNKLSVIKEEHSNGGCFNVVSLLSSSFDNIDRYTLDGKTYVVEYNDNTSDNKRLSVEKEFDILNGKTTSKFWLTSNNRTYQHGRGSGSFLKKISEIKPMNLPEPSGDLFYMQFGS